MFTVPSVWVALPQATSADGPLRLSVYVSLRLSSDNPAVDNPSGGPVTLAQFPALLDWPSLVNATTFTVSADGAEATVAATAVSPAADSDLWRAVFSSASPVVLHAVDDYSGRAVSTYPNAAAADALRAGYPKVFGSSPINLPQRPVLEAAFPALAQTASPGPMPLDEAIALDWEATDELTVLRQAHDALSFASGQPGDDGTLLRRAVQVARRIARLDPAAYTPIVGGDVPASRQLLAFHRTAAALADATSTTDGANGPQDVHQALTALAEYPALLRMLGLVVDLELPAGALPPVVTAGAPGRVRVTPNLPAPLPGPAPYVPHTAYLLDNGVSFTVAPSPPAPRQPVETVSGLLNLAGSGLFDLVQVDVDGATLQTANALTAPADVGGLPALRTAGISVTRTGRGQDLYARMLAALQTDAAITGNADPVTLYDRDLIRGHRIDVLDTDATNPVWRSLHARHGSYNFPAHPAGPTTVELDDEGIAQAAMGEHPTSGPNPPVVVHESIAHWQGWSLASVLPGKAAGEGGANPGTLPGPFPLATQFSATPASLPRLRYGHRYRLRARTVDLAGNSLDLAGADAVLAGFTTPGQDPPVLPTGADGLTYARFEPVPAPVLVPREQPAEGESVERIVIRSSLTESTTECADRLRAAVTAERPAVSAGYLGVSERHVVPAKGSHSIIETSGLFDAYLGAGADPTGGYLIALRDGGLDDLSVVDVATGTAVPIPPTTGIDPITGQLATRPSVEPAQPGVNTAVVHHEPNLQLPYLPDPLARGAVLFGLPGLAPDQAADIAADGTLTIGPNPLTTSAAITNAAPAELGSVTRIPFGTNWPERQPFLLRLAEPPADGPAAPAWDPAARVLTVFLPKGEEAVVRVASYLTGNDRDLLGQWRWLTAALAEAQPPIALDDAALRLADAGTLWLLTPARTLRLVHALQTPLQPPAITSLAAVRGTDDPGTYLAGAIGVHGTSTAKIDLFAQWTEQSDDPAAPQPTQVTRSAHVYEVPLPPTIAGDGPPLPSDDSVHPIAQYAADVLTLLAPTQPPPHGLKPPPDDRPYTSRQEFGDPRHRTVRYHAVATSRYRDYFPAEAINAADALTQVGAPVEIEIPSSSRPAAPRIIGCYPTQRWQRPDGTYGVRTRDGNGVRILLARPWFSSGDGELLAVLTAPPENYPPDDGHRTYLSHWGADPVWRTDEVPPLTRDQLAGEARVAGEFQANLAEVTSSVAHVVAYQVSFDQARGLWAVDVELDPGTTYRPLVRLALARYQASSLPGLELSRVALTDQIQCLPDRAITVDPVPGDADTIAIQVDGPTYVAGSWPGAPNIPADAFDILGVSPVPTLIDVAVQQRIPGTSGDVGWRPAPADLLVSVTATNATLVYGRTDPSAPLWSGTVTVPADRQPGEYRILITEREHFSTDTIASYSYKQVVDPDPDGPPGHLHHPIIVTTRGTYHPGDHRITLIETVDL